MGLDGIHRGGSRKVAAPTFLPYLSFPRKRESIKKMANHIYIWHTFTNMRKVISITILVAFIFTVAQMPSYAELSAGPWLPAPGTMVALSPAFAPAQLKGIVIHPEDALKFDFIIDQGNSHLSEQEKQIEYKNLIKFFLASLAVPDKDQWVNLSPYEKSSIIEKDFSQTLMGRDLLAQDYLLKQITSSLIYPEKDLGRTFWNKVYAQAQNKYGNTNIPVNTFNKVWIVPDKAVIYEKGNVAYVIENHLKVMLDEDYQSTQIHQSQPRDMLNVSPVKNILKEILLPELTKEVNQGQNFATLRQIYSGMLLAAWYKRELKESLLSKTYADKLKLQGVNVSKDNIESIYQLYLQAYKKGVFNYIKQEPGKTIPRKYFSGGTKAYQDFTHEVRIIHQASRRQLSGLSAADDVVTNLKPDALGNAAMLAKLRKIISNFITQDKKPKGRPLDDKILYANLREYRPYLDNPDLHPLIILTIDQLIRNHAIAVDKKSFWSRITAEKGINVYQRYKITISSTVSSGHQKAAEVLQGQWPRISAELNDAQSPITQGLKAIYQKLAVNEALDLRTFAARYYVLMMASAEDETPSDIERRNRLFLITYLMPRAKVEMSSVDTKEIVISLKRVLTRSEKERFLKTYQNDYPGDFISFWEKEVHVQFDSAMLMSPPPPGQAQIILQAKRLLRRLRAEDTVDYRDYNVHVNGSEPSDPAKAIARHLQEIYFQRWGIAVFDKDFKDWRTRRNQEILWRGIPVYKEIVPGSFEFLGYDYVQKFADYLRMRFALNTAYPENSEGMKEALEQAGFAVNDLTQGVFGRQLRSYTLDGYVFKAHENAVRAFPDLKYDARRDAEFSESFGRQFYQLLRLRYPSLPVLGKNAQEAIQNGSLIQQGNEFSWHGIVIARKSAEGRFDYIPESGPLFVEALAQHIKARFGIEAQDKAMNGGIDFNASHLDLRIKRDGRGMPLPFAQQDLAQLSQMKGLEPEILEIRPALSVPVLRDMGMSGR